MDVIFPKHFLYEKQNLCYTFIQLPIEPAALADPGGPLGDAFDTAGMELKGNRIFLFGFAVTH